MKSLTSLILSAALICSFNASASLITNENLVVSPGSTSIVANENQRLFRVINLGVLASDFDANAIFANPLTHIALSGTSVSNSVTASEVSNSDGTITRTTSNIRTTTERTLLEVMIDEMLDLSGFSFGNIAVSGNSIFLDFQNIDIFDTSSLSLDVMFQSESTTEILNQSSEIIPASISPSNPTAVSAPHMAYAGLIGFFLILMRIQFLKQH